VRQVIKHLESLADDWHYAGKDEAVEGAAPARIVLPLAEYLTARAGGAAGEATAVRLVPTDIELEPLQPWLSSLPLVVVEFASTGDGRGFTQGRLLRERFEYRGELRASGKGVRADQIFFLARCGFDAFELAEGENPATALAQLDRFTVAYQDSPDGLVHPRRRYGG
jgi:uncharacterized protein (DUF934 family)